MTYNQFIASGIDLSPVGLLPAGAEMNYFCTPLGAKIIGKAGVDGIHYCFVKGYGEAVFAVSPMNVPGEYVHPIAGCWDDLLQMLLTCADLAALEQAHQWSKEQFDAFLAENPPTPEQRRTLDAIREYTGLEPIDDPYDYLREVQAHTDCSLLRFSDEYYDTVPEERPERRWAVTYNGGFWGQEGKPGEEVSIQKRFHWDGLLWYVPAVYGCPEGLVVDLCVKIDPNAIKAFFSKWYPTLSANPHLPEAVRRQVEQEHPMTLRGYHFCACVNGDTIRQAHNSSIQWIPDSALPATVVNPEEAEEWISHYELDRSQGWVFKRICFPWDAYSGFFSLQLTLSQIPQTIYGIRFSMPEIGDRISFTHPVFGSEHILTVIDTEEGQMDDMRHIGVDIPTHYAGFTYQLTPELTNLQFSIRDTVPSDEPRISNDSLAPFSDAASIGIIGGADGPTYIFVSAKSEPKLHKAISALHFEPVQEVLWEMTFHEKLTEDMTVALV